MLLRHAKSAWPDVPDHERPLAGRGERAAPVMGRWLRATGHVPDLVLCSTARRARETWRLAAAELGATPPVRFDDRLYRASAPDLLGLARRAPSPVRTLLIVGHDPAIHDLAVTLAGSGSGAAAMAGRMRVKFPTGAVAVLEFTGNWDQLGGEGTRLTSFVTPREVEAS